MSLDSTLKIIGMGLARKLVFAWGGNPGVGSLHRLREAIEQNWPKPLEIDERSHSNMANAYAAGASGLPFAVFRGHIGDDLPKVNPTIKRIACPFTGEQLAAVPAMRLVEIPQLARPVDVDAVADERPVLGPNLDQPARIAGRA